MTARQHVVAAAAPLTLFALALAVRLHQHHDALLYPDGYQYLLMARGIGEHLQPTTTLGPGGDTFVPSPDAGVKPLFPLLVAAVHALGASWLGAAQAVTAVAGAWAVAALALLVAKLGGSRLAGLGAGVLVLASPSIGFWSGFSGPDPLALALVLSAGLAFAHGRDRSGGTLAGLAIATRPELALIAVAAAVLSLRTRDRRRRMARAGPPAVLSAALVFGLLRTPVSVTDWRLAWLLPVALAALGLVLVAPPVVLRYSAVAALGVVALVVALEPGPAALWQDDWPLLLLGAAGLLVLVRDRDRDTAALVVLILVLLLGSVYLVKNPTLGRYFALLLPCAALLAGMAASALSVRGRIAAVGAMTVAAAIGVAHPVPGSRDYDMFPMVAQGIADRLEPAPEPLVTAAPDAYGFWLPEHAVQRMRPGVRGAILLDAAQRLYEPGLGAKGEVLARVTDGIAFSHPDLEIDAGPAILVAGEVVAASQAGR